MGLQFQPITNFYYMNPLSFFDNFANYQNFTSKNTQIKAIARTHIITTLFFDSQFKPVFAIFA